MILRDLPPRDTCYYYVAKFQRDGSWKGIYEVLYQKNREQQGSGQPRVAILNAQSVKSAEIAGERGYDAGKKNKGTQKASRVDSQGLLLAVMVTTASVQDRQGGRKLLKNARQTPLLQNIETIWADQGYSGKLVRWAKRALRWRLQIVPRRILKHQFVLEPKRWILERSFAWLNLKRRLAKDVEYALESSTAWIYLNFIHLISKRLGNN